VNEVGRKGEKEKCKKKERSKERRREKTGRKRESRRAQMIESFGKKSGKKERLNLEKSHNSATRQREREVQLRVQGQSKDKMSPYSAAAVCFLFMATPATRATTASPAAAATITPAAEPDSSAAVVGLSPLPMRPVPLQASGLLLGS